MSDDAPDLTQDTPSDDPHESRSLDSISGNAGSSEPSDAPQSSGQPHDFVDSPADAPEPTEQPTKGWRDVLAEQGFNLPQDADDATIAQQIAQSYQQTYQQAQAAAQYRQQAAELQYRLQQHEFAQQQQWAAQQAAPPQQPEPKKPSKPEYNPAWEKDVVWDAERGRYRGAHDDVPYAVVEKYAAHKEWQRERLSKALEFDPDAYREEIKAQLQQEMQQQVQSVIQQVEQRQRHQQMSAVAQQILGAQKDQLFQTDATGNPIIDQFTGEPVLSPIGQQYHSIVLELNKRGYTNPQEKDYVANAILHYQRHVAGQQGQQPQPQAAPPVLDKRDQYRNQVNGRTSNRTGSLTQTRKQSTPQNPNLSWMEMARAEAQARGYQLTTSD
jgi:hypothetical protein